MAVAVESGRNRAAALLLRPTSARARAWNQKIRAVVRPETPGELPFFCECGMDYCQGSVWLTLQEALDRIESGGLIIGAHFFGEREAQLRRRR
jgi:hypothetical protein